MCLLVVKNKDADLSVDELVSLYESAYAIHDDGFGVVWYDEKQKRYFRRRYVARVNPDVVRELAKGMEGCPAILHWRMATSGWIYKDNCHPFKIASKDIGTIFMGHNGVISSVKPVQGMSDTATLARNLTGSESTPIFEQLDKLSDTRNKFATLSGEGELRIHNSQNMGSWQNGIWYSNLSHTLTTTKKKSNYHFGGFSTKEVTYSDSSIVQTMILKYGYDVVRHMITKYEEEKAELKTGVHTLLID